MDDQTVLLLNEVVKNAEMGKNTVTQLLGITDDERLKIHLNRQLATYEDLSKRANAMLAVEGEQAEGQNAFTKLNAKMGVKIQTIYDKSPRKIAEMLIEGSHVGVTDMTHCHQGRTRREPGRYRAGSAPAACRKSICRRIERISVSTQTAAGCIFGLNHPMAAVKEQKQLPHRKFQCGSSVFQFLQTEGAHAFRYSSIY